jgi:hypothetical protein
MVLTVSSAPMNLVETRCPKLESDDAGDWNFKSFSKSVMLIFFVVVGLFVVGLFVGLFVVVFIFIM